MIKRYYIATIVLALCMFLVSCAEGNSDNNLSENPVVPPRKLRFNSFQQMAELRSLYDEPDDSFVLKYLDDHNYSMNGIPDKSHTIKILIKSTIWTLLT